MKKYLWNIIVSIDQLINTLIGGDPDETISSRMGKYVLKGRGFVPCVLCKIIDIFDKDHCIKNIEIDRGDAVDDRFLN
jgi:hypothetical protein